VPRKQFLFEKKNQKTFARFGAPAVSAAYIESNKSFLFLFFKKEKLPCFALVGPAQPFLKPG
jgi:hypothetical protein